MKRRKARSVTATGTLAHDLLNRLGIIVGNCDLANERLPQNSEVAKHLAAIREAAHAMTVTVKSRIASPGAK